MAFNWKVALAAALGASLGLNTAYGDSYATSQVAAVSTSSDIQADLVTDAPCAEPCYEDPSPFEIFPANDWGLKIGGWTQLGYHSDDSIADFFNQYEDHVALHQQWLYAEKAADGSCGWDWGFRFDAMYGIDADNTQAFGNPGGRWDNSASFDHGEYGFALPQAYVEVANGDLSVIVGHFFTTIGYEVVPAPDNFFYSHAWTMNNSEPFTHTGALATYAVNDSLTVYGGWTAGWDTGFDQFRDGSNFLGGFSLALNDSVDLIYMTTFGDFGWAGRDAYSHSIVLDVDLTDRLNYVLQSDLMRLGEFDAETIGINQYLLYDLNDTWAVGARVEWWKPNAESGYNATFGVNWKPHSNFVMRPEVRHEWVPTIDYEETIFGIDAILTY